MNWEEMQKKCENFKTKVFSFKKRSCFFFSFSFLGCSSTTVENNVARSFLAKAEFSIGYKSQLFKVHVNTFLAV